MTLKQRIHAFVELGKEIRTSLDQSQTSDKLTIRQQQLRTLSERIHLSNGWFTEENVKSALTNISEMIDEKALNGWLDSYNFIEKEKENLKTVGVVMAGNIPAVGFHDLLCVLISGNKIKAKLSSSDNILIPALAAMLVGIQPDFSDRIIFTEERLVSIDAIIATGSNNSSRYFEFYFSRFPNIIRKNRTSVAILTGKESSTDIRNLYDDIFKYYGLGCRNVSKIFIPYDYDLIALLNASVGWERVAENKKYFNNYEYNKAIYLVNSIPHFDNGFLLMKEDNSFHSPVSVVFYEKYHQVDDVFEILKDKQSEIQCIISHSIKNLDSVPFGSSQKPTVKDYADGLDTMQFLFSL